MSRICMFAIMLLLFTAPAAGQKSRINSATGKQLKIVPITQVDPTSGEQMYQTYCASCHGMNGTGNGPAVEFLPAPPADLTSLASRNQGKYPVHLVVSTLKFGTASHGQEALEMPVWTKLFHSMDSNRSCVDLRVHNVTEYVRSLQQ